MEKTVKDLAKAKEETEKKKDAPAEEKAADDTSLVEGIELGEPMDEITLDAAEQAKLSQLFA